MEQQYRGLAIGYFKVNDLEDRQELQKQLDRIGQHCELHRLRLVVTFGDERATSENFSGAGWTKAQALIKLTSQAMPGLIGTLVVPEQNMISTDPGRYLLKQYELKQDGVSIDITGDRGQDLVHSREVLPN